jgi:ABC-2 type transport system ATP-binding protein
VLFDQLLDHCELSRTRRIWRLSRGQRAQVALALALAPEPELLILDDPTLGLDTVVRRDFLESMIQIIQREGRTILFSSHILGDVERVADRIGIEDTPKPFPESKGIISDLATGHRRELVIVNYSDEHRQKAESLKPMTMEVVDMNLEDAFIEYSRGRKRAMPTLSESKAELKQKNQVPVN